LNKLIKKLLIKTKKAVFSQQIGNNTSKIKGEGYDFIELREYEDGEDIRKIDWVISAKIQKPYVKVFNTQRELDIKIVTILNGSIHFGTVRMKQELISEICATIGYVCSAQGDNFSSFITNEKTILNTKPTKKILGVDKMVDLIASYDCIGKGIEYKSLATDLYRLIPKRSIVFLIGDFFDCDDLDLRVLSKKHEVIAIITRDKFEENPIQMGNVNFIDPQTFKRFNGDLNKTIIDKYSKKIKLDDKKLYEKFKMSGVDFLKIYTDDNVISRLLKLF
jgi:uncharacterized protein (DUF58 family)